eukprot:scaffold645781_cov29-Prasinocladus_malaysianus.AAC.1
MMEIRVRAFIRWVEQASLLSRMAPQMSQCAIDSAFDNARFNNVVQQPAARYLRTNKTGGERDACD